MLLRRGGIHSWLGVLVVSYAALFASGAALQSSTQRRLQYSPGGIQTGPDALQKPSYASFARFNPADGTVVITGATYGSFFDGSPDDGSSPIANCFLATARVPTAEQPGLEWVDRTTLDSTVHESCTHLIIHPISQAMLVAGESHPDGILKQLYNPGTTVVSAVTGSLVHFSRPEAGSVGLVGGRVMQNDAVMYPHAIANRPGSTTVYVASMESSDSTEKPLPPELPGMYNPSDFHKFGSSYDMVVRQYTWAPATTAAADGSLTQTLTPGWNQPYSTLADDAVSVSGMVQVDDDRLVVVGSTSGGGAAFGTPTGASLDAFVTVITAATGAVESAARIASSDDMADAITGVCFAPTDPRHVFLAGVTQGRLHDSVDASTIDGSIQVFIMKWDLVDSRAIWVKQVVTRAPSDTVKVSDVKETACAVSPDGNSLWLAGVVGEGFTLDLSGTESSYGLDDIFVSKLNPVDGIVYFTRQLGSESRDSLAANGGLTTDQQGNAIVVGMTHGTFYRQRDDEVEDHSVSDVFVTTVAIQNGAIAQPLTHSADPVTTAAPTPSPVAPTAAPTPATVAATVPPTPSPVAATAAPTPAPVPAPTAPTNPIVPNTTSVSNGSGIERWVALLLLLLALIIGIIMASFYYYNQKTSSLLGKDAHTDRNKVLSYLGEFDVEDVDLKHSATGGWHCSYTGDLARGRNKKSKGIGGLPGPGLMEASSAHSSVYVDDPLTAPLSPDTKALDDKVFLDQFEGSMSGGLNLDALPPEGGGNASESSSGYDALIDAYNSSINWDDLRRGPGERGFSSSNHGGARDRGKWGRDIV